MQFTNLRFCLKLRQDLKKSINNYSYRETVCGDEEWLARRNNEGNKNFSFIFKISSFIFHNFILYYIVYVPHLIYLISFHL